MAHSLSPPHEPAETGAVLKPERKRKISPVVLIPLGLVLAGVGVSTWYFLAPTQVKSLRLSGRIEGYETDIGAKVAGRVASVALREGDEVHKGQVIAQLDDAEIQAQLKGASARLVSTQQQELQARLQINLLESQIQEQELNLQQAQGDAKGRIFQAESSVAASLAQLNQAEAQLQQAKSELKLAQTNRDRFAKLLASGVITQQQFDQFQTTFESAQATVASRQASVDSFQKLVDSAQGQLLQAQTTGLNPSIRNAQMAGLRTQLAQTRLKLAAAQAEVANAKAAQQETQAKVADLNIISPIDGVVTTRSVEPGAVVSNGKTLLTLINPKDVYLRGYIPEGDIGKVRVGQQARVFLDSAPKKPLSARVSAIDTQASFTPENIYFQKDRVKQVFGVKISIDNPAGFAKPGMPANAEIVTESEAKK
jgi:HlyD family secretion protein